MRAAARQVGPRVGARLVVLLGSAARRHATPADVDVGILTDRPFDVIAATNLLIQSLGVQPIDVADLRRADPLLLALAARDGIPLYEAEPGEFARFASLAARRFADTRKFRTAERDEVRAFLRTGRGRG
jgi:predicted nucleotidyltransferase